jgi:integrase/recombinase XerD
MAASLGLYSITKSYRRPLLERAGLDTLPTAIAAQGERAGLRFIEFFTATIRNRNTRMAYARAVKRFFDWCDEHHLGLEDIEPIAISAYLIRSTSSSKMSSVVRSYSLVVRKVTHFKLESRT